MRDDSVIRYLLEQESLLGNKLLNILDQVEISREIRSAKRIWAELYPHYRSESIVAREEVLPPMQETQGINTVSDLRIKNIRLRNFRGISQTNRSMYGLSFVDDGIPCSVALYGNNGTGKSSLYEAAEFLLTKKIGEADYRAYLLANMGRRYQEYIQHANNVLIGFPECFIETMSGTIKYSNGIHSSDVDLSEIATDLCFISENDIYKTGLVQWTGDSSDSFHDLMATKLGLSDWLDWQYFLNALRVYDNEDDREEELNLQHEIALNTDRLTQLKIELLKYGHSDNSDSGSQLAQKTEYYTKLKSDSPFYKSITSEMNSIINQLSSLISNVSIDSDYSATVEFIGFLESGIKIINIHPGCPFCEDSNLNNEQIKSDVNTRLGLYRANMAIYDRIRQSIQEIFDLKIEFMKILSSLESRLLAEILEIQSWYEFNEIRDLNESLSRYLRDLHAYLETQGSVNNQVLDDFLKKGDLSAYLTNIYIPALMNADVRFKKYSEKRSEALESIAKYPSIGDSTLITNYERLLQLEELKREIESSITEQNKRLSHVRISIDLYKKMNVDATELYQIVSDRLSRLITERIEPIVASLNMIMDRFLDDEGMDIHISLNKLNDFAPEKYSVVLKNRDTQEMVSPAKYFNSFRYKLFCLIINIGMLFAYIKLRKINLPLLIDDAFYSSDFENSVRFEKSISLIIEVFNQFFPEYSLQLIVFSHEVQIFNSAYEALNRKRQQSKRIRLFKHSQAVKQDSYYDLGYTILSDK